MLALVDFFGCSDSSRCSKHGDYAYGRGLVKYDLHIHSKYSDDGVLDPKEVVKLAKERGFDGIAITDHNTIRGGQEAQKYEAENFKVVIGAEIMTERGEITGLSLHEEVKARQFRDVIAEIKAQGGDCCATSI